MTISEAVQALQNGQIYDGGLLSSADQARLRDAVDAWPSARVVLVPDADLAAWRVLWEQLGLSSQDDLLLLYNGRRWEARGWGLSPAEVTATLEAAEGALAKDPVAGLTQALTALNGAAFGGSWAPIAAGVGMGGVGLLAAIGMGLLARRARVIRERKTAIDAARSMLDEELADLVLAADGQPDEQVIRGKTERIRMEMLGLSKSDEDPKVIQGRAEQVQRELAGLRTQLRNRRAHGD